jgi:hypothetical protein
MRLVHPLLARAAERSGEWFDKWCDLLATGRMQLWVGWNGSECEAAVLTEIVTRAKGKTCQIVACGGHAMPHWLGLLDEIEQWAKQEGCASMRVVAGRKGWARMLPDYAVTGITLEREI